MSSIFSDGKFRGCYRDHQIKFHASSCRRLDQLALNLASHVTHDVTRLQSVPFISEKLEFAQWPPFGHIENGIRSFSRKPRPGAWSLALTVIFLVRYPSIGTPSLHSTCLEDLSPLKGAKLVFNAKSFSRSYWDSNPSSRKTCWSKSKSDVLTTRLYNPTLS